MPSYIKDMSLGMSSDANKNPNVRYKEVAAIISNVISIFDFSERLTQSSKTKYMIVFTDVLLATQMTTIVLVFTTFSMYMHWDDYV
ncbi:hypothetical protein Z517_09231 [Fonsecaea pedrosoi CBS 271.37]|uniref:Uncharacterized protein n=1 Tax=Fonsecaea pedrosoi CBS 271.37 TaxID=1442368 RepID=A0A0D2ERA0_9EURO|nr:uncharacterized protein Z517_09231 [Fonsecaea pedrosoi CBS 271.37]KIW76787.1 hypothetical protein Z517_09231 [Fonsecaea pedrosoi CBS 271.37]